MLVLPSRMDAQAAQGWRQEFSGGGADSCNEGAKIRFSGGINIKISKKIAFHLPTGGGAIPLGPSTYTV